MKNINRDFLVTVNAKTAEIKSVPDNMKFYVTDRYTCNIFFQLTIDETSNSFINAPTENASDYTLTLRVLKPNNEHKNIVATLLNKNSNFFVADLTPDFTDFIGIYECELFIETTINGRSERSTTEPFQYEVEKSVFSFLDEIIEGDPDYPLLIDTLATKDYVEDYIEEAIENMDLTDYATRNYVNEAIADINLTYYATKDYVHNTITDNLIDYTTKDYVDQAIFNAEFGEGVDLNNYATKSYVIQTVANIDLSNYVTDEEFSDTLANLSNYVTDEELSDTLASYTTDKELSDALTGVSYDGHTHPDTFVYTYASNNILTLTTDKYQVAINLIANTKIVLPEVEDYTEIHLFYTPIAEIELTLPSAKYQSMSTMEIGKTYEFIFTYVAGNWLAGVIAYG